MMKQLVYVGPDLPGISARYTVYNNGLPKALEEHIKTKPVFRSLVVPVERLAQILCGKVYFLKSSEYPTAADASEKL